MKTTNRQFKLFAKVCDRFFKGFGLSEWQITMHHEPLDDCRAQCAYNAVGRQARITLSTDWDDYSAGNDDGTPFDAHVQRSAYHEMCELLLAPYHNAAMEDAPPQCKELRLTEAGHSIIRRLENAYWPIHLLEMRAGKSAEQLILEGLAAKEKVKQQAKQIAELQNLIKTGILEDSKKNSES